MMSPTVMFIGNFLPSIGNREVSEELAARLVSAGWGAILASKKRNRLARLADMVYTAWRMRREYEVAHVDVFSGRAFLWAELVCSTLRRMRKPIVLTLRGGNLPRFAVRWPSRVRSLLRSAKAVTVPSDYLLGEMRQYRSDLHRLPNAIELGAYRFRTRERPLPNLLWLRAFHRVYNPELAPKVLAILSEDYPDATLTMVGPDKGDRSMLRTTERAREFGVIHSITFTGGLPKADVATWMDREDIFLNTTNVDNTPVSVLEAMASGLCIVSTRVGGIPYMLQHDRDALLVPPEDPDAMANAVRRILAEPGLAARLSQSAREKSKRYDWTAILPQWIELLTAVSLREAS